MTRSEQRRMPSGRRARLHRCVCVCTPTCVLGTPPGPGMPPVYQLWLGGGVMWRRHAGTQRHTAARQAWAAHTPSGASASAAAAALRTVQRALMPSSLGTQQAAQMTRRSVHGAERTQVCVCVCVSVRVYDVCKGMPRGPMSTYLPVCGCHA